MVNRDRVRQKIPILLTDAPWWSGKVDTKYSQVKKFRVKAPEKYLAYENKVVAVLKELDEAASQFHELQKSCRRR